jgi:hypothetical protein
MDPQSASSLSSTTPTPLSFGISTILLDMETFWGKDNLFPTIAQVLLQNELQFLGLMFTFMQKDDKDTGNNAEKPCRQLALASTNKDRLNHLMAYLMDDDTSSSNADLHLTGIKEEMREIVQPDSSSTTIYVVRMDQGNSAASRKQIAPILMGFWKDPSQDSL